MGRVIALLPAHNEAAGIVQAIESLRAQTQPPSRIIVVADNCTDDTALLAGEAGAEVFESVDNEHRKAGALNQAIAAVLPHLEADDYLLVQDADSTLSPEFLAIATERLDSDRKVGAVGGVFYGDRGCGLLGLLQRMEYARYARDLRRSGRVWVLTGTATVHRPRVLRQIAEERGSTLPGRVGDVYDRSALTEDMEVTVAIKRLGHTLVSPADCRVTTEVMPTLRALFAQRLRWQRGALENLRAYGMNRTTLPYFRQQGLMALSMLALMLYIGATAYWTATGSLGVDPFWTSIGGIFVAERVVTAWRAGWFARGVSVVLVLDLAYDLFLQSVVLRAAADSVLRRPERWVHATPERG